jgi:hypothetical protein
VVFETGHSFQDWPEFPRISVGLPIWPGYSRPARASRTGQGLLGLAWVHQLGRGILDWPELPGLARTVLSLNKFNFLHR